MSQPEIAPGCIFHWEEYEFSDGEKANKYIVIVGAKDGKNYLAVIATSQKHKRNYNPGCHAKEGWYHIPGGRKDWFLKDTWLLIAEPKELIPEEFLKRVTAKQVELKGSLRTDITNAIKNCIKECPDVSENLCKLL